MLRALDKTNMHNDLSGASTLLFNVSVSYITDL
jgi:hypothetical protein